MTRIQLREIRTEAEERAFYAHTYPGGYQHHVWPDHIERVDESVQMISQYSQMLRTAADLSCGDGAIIKRLDLKEAYLADLNGPPAGLATEMVQGGCWKVVNLGSVALPDSLWKLPEKVDLIILSETLEHVPDPDDLLRTAAHFGRHLFLSTPVDEPADSGNREHYWGWGQDDIHGMLQQSGWDPVEVRLFQPRSTVDLPGAYTFQLWMAAAR